MKRTFNWKPEFPKRNDKIISFASDEVQTYSASREVGIMICEDVEKQSPACFWIDEQNVFLRMNWGKWYKVSNNSPEIISVICQRHTAKLMQVIGNRSIESFIPVFHIDRLPVELFEGVQNDRKTGETADEIGEEDQSAPEPEKKPDPNARSRQLFSRTISGIGQVIGEYKKGDCEVFLIRSGPYLVLASFFAPESRVWMADEEPFNDEPPLWFSESVHIQSPLYEIGQAAEYLRTNFCIKVIPVAILDDDIVIINADEMQETWRKTGVRICYGWCEQNGIPAFDQYIFSDEDEECDDQTAEDAKQALNIYFLAPRDDRENAKQEIPDEVPPQDAGTGRSWCLGKYHCGAPCCDFELRYDLHRLRLVPDESSDHCPSETALEEIGRMISKNSVYSDFGLMDTGLKDDPDEARACVEAANMLFTRSNEWGEFHPYDSDHNDDLQDRLVRIEKFWRCGNPVALRDVGVTAAPLWSLVFETEPAALYFHYPRKDDWQRKNMAGLLGKYAEEYESTKEDHPDLMIFGIVILGSGTPEILRELNEKSPSGLVFVSPGILNETVMKIFMEHIFNRQGKADLPELE